MSDDLRARVLAALADHLTADLAVHEDSDAARSLEHGHPNPAVTVDRGERSARFTHRPRPHAELTVGYGAAAVVMQKTTSTSEIADAVMTALDDRQRAYEDLLASLWLYIGFHEVKKLTTEQKNLLADSVDAHSARLAAADPTYGEPVKVERWWVE